MSSRLVQEKNNILEFSIMNCAILCQHTVKINQQLFVCLPIGKYWKVQAVKS